MKSSLACLLAFVVASAAADLHAAVDQNYTPPTNQEASNVTNGIDWAQTFAVGITGTMTGFDAWVDHADGITQPLLYDIRTVDAGSPSLPNAGINILASGSVAASALLTADGVSGGPEPGSFPHIDLASPGVPVVAGEVLALVLRTNDPGVAQGVAYTWHGDSPGAYAGGSPFFRTSTTWVPQTHDQFFRTYVTAVPEPTTGLLWILGFAGVAPLLGIRTRIAQSRIVSSTPKTCL
jgi:hypothetical protein